MRECQDTSGVWGQPCPSCGVVLPNPGPWRSSRTERREIASGTVTGRRWTEAQRVAGQRRERARALRVVP